MYNIYIYIHKLHIHIRGDHKKLGCIYMYINVSV